VPDGKLRVLVADDEEQFIIAYATLLEDAGYEVITATSKKGLICVAPQAQVLVVDACLPSLEYMEGIEAVAELIGSSQLGPEVPVVFFSGFTVDDPMISEKLKSYPVLVNRYEWVNKDDDFEAIPQAINRLLQRNRR
jgi:CheY-like chemotaxis protein